MSFEPRFTVSNRITADLTRVERARGFIEAATLSEDWIRRMGAEALLLEAHQTTHIEGTQLTLHESERLFAGGVVRGANPDDVRELLNYRDAFELVSTWLDGNQPVTEAPIREIHRLLCSSRESAVQLRRAGRVPARPELRGERHYRQDRLRAAAGDEVPTLMHELVEWLNLESDVHPVLASGIAQFQLVHIHPFLDGNGRTSRLLSTLCLYRAGYDFKRLFTISEYYDRNRPAFYRAIQGVREQGMDLTGWLEYFTKGLATQLDEVKARGERTIRQDVLAREHALSDRQAAALSHAIEHRRLTVQDFQRLFPDTNRRTLQRDLRALLEKALLVEAGTAPTDPARHYRPRPGLT